MKNFMTLKSSLEIFMTTPTTQPSHGIVMNEWPHLVKKSDTDICCIPPHSASSNLEKNPVPNVISWKDPEILN